MLNDLELFYMNRRHEEQEALLFLRRFILDASENLSEHFKFKTAFFYFNGKIFCYFGQEKKSRRLYIGFVMGKHLHHPALLKGTRKQIKILPLEINKDIDLILLTEVLNEAIKHKLSA